MHKKTTSLARQKKAPFFKSLKQDIVKNYDLYLMAVPGVLFYLFFKYWPMYGLQIAFRNFNPALGITGSRWVGLKYFEKFVTGFNFSTLMTNTSILTTVFTQEQTKLPTMTAPRFSKTNTLRLHSTTRPQRSLK